MAESAVAFLLQTLGSLLQQEPSLIQGFRSSLDEIQLELQSMRSFLKDADRKMYSDDGAKSWVGQVREAAYKVEDIIDEYRYNVVANEDRGWAARLVLHHYYMRQTASELQAIKSEICEISERRKRYDFQTEQGSTSSQTKGDHEDGENWQRSAKRPRFIPDEDIVGIEKNKDFLIRRLIDENPERVVLSVVGMAGVGKTTLVTKAYDSPQVKNHFNCHALITVSQSYKFDELLRSLIKELYKSCNELIPCAALGKMNTSDLVEMVFDYLQKKESLFPEDYTIPQNRLIRLWVAEGFIENHGRLTLEEVAAEYIEELTCRSLLQTEADHERVSKCLRMHDVFRELALEITREEKFCDAHVAKVDIQSNEARRLSFHYFIGSIQSG